MHAVAATDRSEQPATLESTMTNLADRLLTSASADPSALAIRLDDVTLSYADLAGASCRLAKHVTDRGLQPGHRVGVMLPNVPEFAIAYYGILLAGGVVVPINPLLKGREIAHYMGDSGAMILLTSQEAADQARTGTAELGTDLVVLEAPTAGAYDPATIVDRADNDTAVILYTSGTTGQAEGGRTHPRQSAPQRRHIRQRLAQTHPRRRPDGLPAAVPHVRADGWYELRHLQWRVSHADQPLRWRQGVARDRARPGERISRGAHDVLRAAQRPRPRPL